MRAAFFRFEGIKCLAVIACTLLVTGCEIPSRTAAPPARDETPVTATAPGVMQPSGRSRPSAAVQKTIIDGYGRAWSVIDRNGTFLIGVDIWAGKYHNFGGSNCHWARLRSVNPSDALDSKSTDAPQVITIRATDTAFFTHNCGTWQMAPAI